MKEIKDLCSNEKALDSMVFGLWQLINICVDTSIVFALEQVRPRSKDGTRICGFVRQDRVSVRGAANDMLESRSKLSDT